MKAFGDRHRELREEAGLVMQDIADLLGQTRTAVALWESGKTEPPYETLLKLADHYGVTLDYLLGRPEARRDSPAVERIKADLYDYLRLIERRLAESTTAERVTAVVSFLQERDQLLYAEARVASRLLIKPPALQRILAGKAQPGPVVIERLAELTGVPVAWFYVPHPHLFAIDLELYRTAISEARDLGYTPESLADEIRKLPKKK